MAMAFSRSENKGVTSPDLAKARCRTEARSIYLIS
jgi:hypothetical protein